MNLEEIKKAIDDGKTVCWSQDNYEVQCMDIKSLNTETMEHEIVRSYDIVCTTNSHRIGLTWRDGVTMNGEEKDFYIKGESNA